MFLCSPEAVVVVCSSSRWRIIGHDGKGADISHRGPDSDPWKEGCQLVKLFPGPAIGGVIVTLGTLDLDTHKNP